MVAKSVLVIAGIIVMLAIAIGLYASGIEDQLIDAREFKFQHGRGSDQIRQRMVKLI